MISDITPEMVEAAARAINRYETNADGWDVISETTRDICRYKAQAALTAAKAIEMEDQRHVTDAAQAPDDVCATQSIQDRAWDFVKVGFQNFSLSDERLREYAKIIEELLQGAVDDATTPLAAQVAKLTEERNTLAQACAEADRRMQADYAASIIDDLKARAERAESELSALDKSHADLARKLANAATDIRAQTIEECAKVADEYATEMRNTIAEDSSELDSLADAEAAGLVIANRIRSLSTSPPPPSGEWRPIEACALDAAFRFYGLHVNDDRGHSWFEAHYLSVADDAQMMCPSGDVFSDWSLSDFEVWCDAAPPPPAEGGER